VLPDDVKHATPAVLTHRLLLSGDRDGSRDVVDDILRTVPAPVSRTQ